MTHWLVTGASGLLGVSLCRALLGLGHQVTGIGRTHAMPLPGVSFLNADLTRAELVPLLPATRIDVIVHAAALTNVDACEEAEAAAYHLHATLTGALASLSAQRNLPFIYISTDQLWNGAQPFVGENVPTQPINAYARTKAAGEQAALLAYPDSLILRTNFFGPGLPWRRSFSDWIADSLRQGRPISGFVDSFFTPIALAHFCTALIELADRGATGIFHVAGSERLSKHAFAVRLANMLGLRTDLIAPVSIDAASLRAPRPRDMSLSTEKVAGFLGRPMPDVDASLATLADTIPIAPLYSDQVTDRS